MAQTWTNIATRMQQTAEAYTNSLKAVAGAEKIIFTGAFGLLLAPLSWFPIRRLRNYFRARRYLEANPVQPSLNLMPLGIPSRPSVAGWTSLTTNARSAPDKLSAGVP
ncbi:hypothetical protein [Actinokineospora sp.]|uniref:hypothetical protein n=1 Tax=Actinokineospora sp. TaxID=1872133 RepID=UPI003D6C379A